MELITQTIQFFLLSLMLGMSLYSALVDTKLTGVGFYKVVLGIVGGAGVASFITYLLNNPWFSLSAAFYIGLFISILIMYFNHKDERSYLMWLFYFTKMLMIIFIAYIFMQENMDNFLFFLSSMGLLGSVTFTMVLGHWYLVTPKLTEKPLAIGIKIMWGVMLIKIISTFYGYSQASEFFTQTSEVGMGYMFNWIMLLMRVAWGYVVIMVMSYFAFRLVKMRSLQSATGILYAMTFFVFIGELISTYLFYNYGLML